MRVLVAIEPRAYREVIGISIQHLRPNLEVIVIEPDELKQTIARFAPKLVMCKLSAASMPQGRNAWVEFHPYEEPAAVISLDGRRTEFENISLEELLSVIDETEELCKTKTDLRND
jgi:hypothetical protein